MSPSAAGGWVARWYSTSRRDSTRIFPLRPRKESGAVPGRRLSTQYHRRGGSIGFREHDQAGLLHHPATRNDLRGLLTILARGARSDWPAYSWAAAPRAEPYRPTSPRLGSPRLRRPG